MRARTLYGSSDSHASQLSFDPNGISNLHTYRTGWFAEHGQFNKTTSQDHLSGNDRDYCSFSFKLLSDIVTIVFSLADSGHLYNVCGGTMFTHQPQQLVRESQRRCSEITLSRYFTNNIFAIFNLGFHYVYYFYIFFLYQTEDGFLIMPVLKESSKFHHT